MESTIPPLNPAITTQELVKRVYSRSHEEREGAEELLLNGHPERTDALLEVVGRENKKKAKRFGFFACGFLGAFILLMVLIEAALSGDGPNIGGFGYPMWMAAAGAAAYFAPTKLQKRAARALAASDDVRAVPPLIEALDKQDSGTRSAAIAALTRLLPRLRADHEKLLTHDQMTILRDQMAKAPSPDFTAAALKAVEQIGDDRFLETVRNWAQGKGGARKSPQLRDAAAACQPLLEARVERQKAGKTLLRAASANPADTGSLLRPAESGTIEPETLLRPAVTRVASEAPVQVDSAVEEDVVPVGRGYPD